MTSKDSQTVPAHLVTPDLWAEMARDAHIDGWPLTAGLPTSDTKRSS